MISVRCVDTREAVSVDVFRYDLTGRRLMMANRKDFDREVRVGMAEA